MPTRLQEQYVETIRPALQKEFGYVNVHQIPKLDKIVLNMGVGEAVADSKKVDAAVGDMTKIAGQKPVVTKARNSIAGFKLREGMPIGCKVTLRSVRMYEFLDRLVEQLVFPEIEYDKIDEIRGMNITICTTAKTDAEAKALLAAFKMPFTS